MQTVHPGCHDFFVQQDTVVRIWQQYCAPGMYGKLQNSPNLPITTLTEKHTCPP